MEERNNKFYMGKINYALFSGCSNEPTRTKIPSMTTRHTNNKNNSLIEGDERGLAMGGAQGMLDRDGSLHMNRDNRRDGI